MNVTVFGAGGMGLYFAAMLARAGHRVTVVGRADTVAAAAEPLVLEVGAQTFSVPGVRAVADVPVDAEAADLVVVAVKAWQVAAAAKTIAPLVGPGTVVLPVQNGVEAGTDLAETLGAASILGCTCVVIAQRVGPWAVRCLGAHATVEIGALAPEFEPAGGRFDGVAAALSDAGIAVTRSADIQATLWRKLMLISSYGGVGALARQPVGVTRAEPATAELVRDAMLEVLAVAQARGIALTEADVDQMMGVYRGFSSDTTSSMQRDLAAGRPSELEYQNGAVLRFGRAAGVPTPIHRTIYASQLPGELAARRSEGP
ncbi:ketopantoate reductase family protein [Nocardia sp. CDC160]|uniref:ketopantoate reductase family protein n=1 Tax=Nocardia sp. CDC160 TaxID=3112166 RepID=UPI002DBFC360|nr:2-dehydropantoate 2-reductase [Nocardia sp. CDC160]MEC3915785.1 2-dehydropantoate 2-reductase [Nocardia sp. CDC160]